MEKVKLRARSLLVIVSTPPTENYGNFTAKVKEYNAKEPFNFHHPTIFRDFEKVLPVKAIIFRMIFISIHLSLSVRFDNSGIFVRFR